MLTLGVGQLLSWMGGITLAVLLPRYLGDVNLGKFAFSTSFVALVGLVASLGVASYLTKEVARHPDSALTLTPSAVVTRLLTSMLAIGLAVAVVNVIGYDPLTRQIVHVLSLGIVIDALGSVVFGTLAGFQWMKPLAVSSVVSKLSYAGIVAALLLNGAGVVQVAVALVGTSALALAIGVFALLRRMPLSARIGRVSMRVVVVGGLPFFVWQAALVVYGQIDFVLLASLTRDAVVGWYAAAYRIVMIPAFLPAILMTVIFPALSAAASDRPTFDSIARRGMQVVMLLSLPMGLGIMLLPDKLIHLFGYPPVFSHSVVPIALLALHIPLVGFDMMIGSILNTLDRQRQWALTGVAAAVLNPALNLIAIPYTQNVYGNGAIGAAAITTLTELFMMIVGLWLIPGDVLGRGTFVLGLKCLVAGAAMAAAVWVLRGVPLPLLVFLGALVYGTCCLALRALTVNDVKAVVTHLWRRGLSSPAAA